MYKIIVVEDEPNVRKELALCTPWQKANVVFSGEAENGEKGFDLIKAAKPDIVLTDIRMPQTDGLAMIKLVKDFIQTASGSSYSEPEWIILSGYTEFEYAHKAMQLGVQEYLLKPVEEQNLMESIARCLERVEQKRKINSITTAAEKGNVKSTAFFNEYVGSDFDVSDYVGKTVNMIREKYRQGITIEDAARTLRISAGYLSRLFRKTTGYTFTDYLMYERISVAAKMLKQTDKKVYEIADMAGYEDYRYFSQIFKRITGFTPLEFKNN